MSDEWKPHVCGGCAKRFSGERTCHCSRCHETFAGVSSFDAHQVNNACISPSLSKRFYQPRAGVWSHLTKKEAEKASVIPAKGRHSAAD